MTISILINDLYLDFTYSKEVSMERRFFVEIEINSTKKEVLTFMCEMNSAFKKYNKLQNIVILDTKDLLEDYEEKDKKNETFQSNKEFLLLNKKCVYNSLKNVILSKIDSLQDNDWLAYCEKRYAIHNIKLTEILKIEEINKFKNSNTIMKELWSSFPENISQFLLGGDMEKSETIPLKFDNFLKEIQYYHLENKLPEQGTLEKKPKI